MAWSSLPYSQHMTVPGASDASSGLVRPFTSRSRCPCHVTQVHKTVSNVPRRRCAHHTNTRHRHVLEPIRHLRLLFRHYKSEDCDSTSQTIQPITLTSNMDDGVGRTKRRCPHTTTRHRRRSVGRWAVAAIRDDTATATLRRPRGCKVGVWWCGGVGVSHFSLFKTSQSWFVQAN